MGDNVYATSSSYYVYATVTWDSNLRVTVNITSANAGWCVKIRGTSTIKCQGSSSNGTGTFTADYDGQEFVLQVYDAEEEQFANNGDPIFTVTSNSGGGSSGGGSSGSGSYDGQYHNVYILKDEGVRDIKVERTWSDFGNFTGKDGNYNRPVYLSSGDRMWYKDSFRITAEPLDGYILDTYVIDEETVNFYATSVYYDNPDINTWRVYFPHPEDLYIYVTTTKISDENFDNALEKECVSIAQAETDPRLFVNGADNLIYKPDAIDRRGFSSFKFMTPDFFCASQYIDFDLGITQYHYMGTDPIYFVLTSSKDLMYQYCTFYIDGYYPNIPPLKGDDPGLIAWKYYCGNEYPSQLRFITNELKPNTIYYLLTLSLGGSISYDTVYNHTVKIGYTTGIYIDDELNRGMYVCCIDTPYISYPQITSECTIVGHDICFAYSSNGISSYIPDYISNSYMYWGQMLNQGRMLYLLKFTTPNLIEVKQKCDINFSIVAEDKIHISTGVTTDNYSPILNYAICTSDTNYNKYLTININTDDMPIDEYMIASGTFTEVLNGANTIVVKGIELTQNTNYYLFVWSSMECEYYTNIIPTTEHSIVVSYNDTTSEPIQLTKYMRYQPYIDNGTTWEPL